MGQTNAVKTLTCKVFNTDRLTGFWNRPLQNPQDNANTLSVSSKRNTLYNMCVCKYQPAKRCNCWYFIQKVSTDIFRIPKRLMMEIGQIWRRSALFWNITQRRVTIIYRRFGTTYRSHFQGPRSPIGCFEKLLNNYHSTLLNVA
jgi:hypothetical protein